MLFLPPLSFHSILFAFLGMCGEQSGKRTVTEYGKNRIVSTTSLAVAASVESLDCTSTVYIL